MKAGRWTVARLCGGRYLRGSLLRRFPGGLASDWLGLIVWKK